MGINIRLATIEDLDRVAYIESICFPEAEAASKKSLKRRLENYPNCFWISELNEEIIGFINGMISNTENLIDEMYSDASLHDEAGDWQMIFGVDILPEYRKRGYAEILLKKVIEETRNRGKKGLVLTCKEHLLHYYEKFGFKNEGISGSEHGGVIWYQMRLIL